VSGVLTSAVAPKSDDARQLAEWTRLEKETLVALYAVLRRRPEGVGLGHPKAVLGQAPPEAPEEPFRSRLALCRAAQARGVLAAFCRDIVAYEDFCGRPEAEAADILRRIGSVGVPHGITNRARDFGNPVMFGRLDQIYRATGYIEDAGGRVLGTTFLIGRDLAITAAHVALRRGEQNGRIVYSPQPAERLQLVFPETPMGEQRCHLHPHKPLVAFAPPFVNDAGLLLSDLTAEAAEHLDYAVLLLDRLIVGTRPVPLDGLSTPSRAELSFVIGYPGAIGAVCDGDYIRDIMPEGGRLIHMMNAVSGMSGSCCTADNGIAVALHEGEIPVLDAAGKPVVDGEVRQVRNRAVMLTAIKTHLDKAPGALGRAATPGGALFDRGLVHQLAKRGQQLAGDAAAQEAWCGLCQRVLRRHPSAEEAPEWDWHPFFAATPPRSNIEHWFGAALEPRTEDRVLCIGGSAGTGKSFCIDRLAARIDDDLRDLVRVERFGGATAVETLAARLGAGGEGEPTRTLHGTVRYDTVEQTVAAIAHFGGRDRDADATAHPFFLAIDAGTETEASLASADWLVLLVALAARPWARLIVCGLTEDAATRLEQAIAANPATRNLALRRETLQHARRPDVTRFFTFGTPLGAQPALSPDEAANLYERQLAAFPGSRDVATALAALICIYAMRPEAGG
jgi:hypothetical protein